MLNLGKEMIEYRKDIGRRKIVTELENELPTYPSWIKSKRSSIIIISKEMSVSLVLSKMSASSVSCGTSFMGESNELGISDWLITIS
uniref:Uncharacterized protein n=1 Tax=Brassica oleracea var. oleracea TaxID=109376 RepID=A0A0D3D569_BRAOL